jgi:hypothetical protein
MHIYHQSYFQNHDLNLQVFQEFIDLTILIYTFLDVINSKSK